METTRLITELARHQDAVLAHLAGTRGLLVQPAERALGEVARRRWELVRLLRGYQLFKHGELFDPLIRRRAANASAAAEMKARCVAIGEVFAAHVRLWSGSDAAAAWHDYVRAETAMIERLRTHLRREREEARRLLPTGMTVRAA